MAIKKSTYIFLSSLFNISPLLLESLFFIPLQLCLVGLVSAPLLLLFIVCLTFGQEKMLGKWSFLTPALNAIKELSTKKCDEAVFQISVPAAAQFLHKQARAVLSSHSSVSETVISNVRAPMSAPSHKFCYLCLLLHHSATLLHYYCLY